MSYDFIGSEAASTFTLTAENDIYVVFVGTTAGNIFKVSFGYSLLERFVYCED